MLTTRGHLDGRVAQGVGGAFKIGNWQTISTPFPMYTQAGATMVIVLMYWLRCMKCLWGYMALSSAVLLGLIGGAVWLSALEVFQIPCDAFSFYGVLWNFAVVGVVAIFYQKVNGGCAPLNGLRLSGHPGTHTRSMWNLS